MKTRTNILLSLTGMLILIFVIGSVAIAAESGGNSDRDGKEDQNPKYEASITVDEQTVEGLSEEEEANALAPLAKISPAQARAAAEAVASDGDTTENELGNENGALVYEVQVGNQEIKIDAGNGNVLHIEKDGGEEN